MCCKWAGGYPGRWLSGQVREMSLSLPVCPRCERSSREGGDVGGDWPSVPGELTQVLGVP